MRFFRGEIDRGFDVGQAVQHFFDTRCTRGAGHAGDRQIDHGGFDGRRLKGLVHDAIIYPMGVFDNLWERLINI